MDSSCKFPLFHFHTAHSSVYFGVWSVSLPHCTQFCLLWSLVSFTATLHTVLFTLEFGQFHCHTAHSSVYFGVWSVSLPHCTHSSVYFGVWSVSLPHCTQFCLLWSLVSFTATLHTVLFTLEFGQFHCHTAHSSVYFRVWSVSLPRGVLFHSTLFRCIAALCAVLLSFHFCVWPHNHMYYARTVIYLVCLSPVKFERSPPFFSDGFSL